MIFTEEFFLSGNPILNVHRSYSWFWMKLKIMELIDLYISYNIICSFFPDIVGFRFNIRKIRTRNINIFKNPYFERPFYVNLAFYNPEFLLSGIYWSDLPTCIPVWFNTPYFLIYKDANIGKIVNFPFSDISKGSVNATFITNVIIFIPVVSNSYRYFKYVKLRLYLI